MQIPSIIFLSLEDWDHIWRRNQFVCATLARRHPSMKILFVGIPRHAPNLVRSLNLKPLFSNPSWQVPEFPNITVTKPLRLGIDSTESGMHLNQRLYRNHVQAMAKRLNLTNPLLWINSHNAYHVPAYIEHSGVVYDITDDWISLSQKDLDRCRTIDADRFLCRTADTVIVCSEKLRELKEPLVPEGKLHLIANGVDAEHYASVLQVGPIPQNLESLPRPIFGYTGTIHSDRVDLPLLSKIAEILPEASFVLVGPSHVPLEEQNALPKNIHFLPAVSYADIPGVMRAFDVSITPHKVTPFTESLNPIKLWEYLAAGKPIVSTNVAGFRDFPQHVRLAATAQEFAAALRCSLEELRTPDATKLSAARQSEARLHSWQSRVDEIEQAMVHAQALVPAP